MLSQREVEKKYNQLMDSVNKDDFYKIDMTNRVNCYKCPCGNIIKTKDIDPGVTPFMHKCDKCFNMASSTFYKDIDPDNKPTFEFYRPSLKETLKLRKQESLLEHVLKGGLLIRKINNHE